MIVGALSISAGWLTTPLNWIISTVIERLFNWLASRGIYFIDIGDTYIRTNLDEANWLKINGGGWEKVESGVSDDEGKKIDDSVIRAFDKFVVFSKVSKRN